jgi:signal peptidase I
MKPFIQPGDRVFIVRTSDPVLPGHAIAFFNSDQLIIHRVYAVRKDRTENRQYRIWGDSSPDSHGEINLKSVEGRVHYLVRNGKKHSLWFRYPFCLLALLLGPLLKGCVVLSRGLGRKK